MHTAARPLITSVALALFAAACAEDATSEAWDYQNTDVELTEDLVIAPGETLRVGPGTHFTAREGVAIHVQGTLIAQGTSAARVTFLGAGAPRSWQGIVIEDGGNAELSQVEIGGATYGLHAQPGASFAVTDAELHTSFKAAVLQADGSIERCVVHASGDSPDTLGEVDPLIDPDGTLLVLDASPTVSDCRFDHSNLFSDMIRVRGNSVPTFDHIEVIEAHCAFHVQDVANNSPVITNSVMRGLTFGIMAYFGKPILEDNVFLDNEVDVGYCYGATEDNTPVLRNNFYSSGAPALDAPCTRIGTTDAEPAAQPNPAAGPSFE